MIDLELPLSTRAYWSDGQRGGEIREDPFPPAGVDQIVVRTHFSALSRGTELLVYEGRVPENQHEVMRCPLQEGSFPGPVKYGYMAAGEVARATADFPKGTPVFALAPHQDWLSLGAEFIQPVPAGLPLRRAVLAANMETALNGVWDSGAAPGDRIAVVGAGVVGCMVARLASRLPGTDVTLVDIDDQKRVTASALDLPFAVHEDAPRECDVVIHCSGAPAGLVSCFGLAGAEATILEMSWYGATAVTLPLGEAFHSKRLTLKSSQVGMLPPSRRPRWDHRRRLAKAIALLADPVFDCLITHEVAFSNLPATMQAISMGEINPLALIIDHR